jgi:hypothetical protein
MVSQTLKPKHMIKRFIFLLLVIVISNKLFCQEKCGDTLKIDFSKLENEYKCTVEYKKSQVVQIFNINRKVFDIEEGKVEKDFNTATPSALTGIKLPSFLFGKLPKPSQAIQPTENLPMDLKMNNETTDPQVAIEAYFAEIKRRVKKLNQATFYYNDLNGLSKNCQLRASQIKDSLMRLTDGYIYGKISFSSNISRQQQALTDSLFNMRMGAEIILGHLKDLIEHYTTSIANKLKSQITTDQTQIKEEKKVVSNKKSTATQKEKANEQIEHYETDLVKRQKELEEFSETQKTLNENLEKAEAAIEEMYKFEKEDNIRIILNAYRLLNHPNFFIYTAKLNKAKKDKTTYTFIVTPKELNECTMEDKKAIEVELLTTGGLKIDFSTGVFVNVGNEDFLGRTYYYKNMSDSTRQIISAKRGPSLMLSVGALMHFYKRTVSCTKIGGSIGVSTTADFATLNFHAGPSIIIGSESRFIITGGVTLKSSPQLDQQLEMNKTYTHLESPDAIPTVNVFPKVGAFISITYNVSRFGKE